MFERDSAFDKIFDTALKIYLFLSPVFFFRDYRPSFAGGLFFLLGALALYCVSLLTAPRRILPSPWAGAFVLWCLVRVFYGDFIGSGEWYNFWLSSAGFMYVFAGVLLYRTVYCHAHDIGQYFKPIVIICWLNMFMVILQCMGIDFMWAHVCSFSKSGFMAHPTQLAQYTAMVMPIVFITVPWLCLGLLFVMAVLKSSTPFIALAVGAVYYARETGAKRWVLAVLGAALALAAYKWEYLLWKLTTTGIRARVALDGLRAVCQRPYMGWGYGSFYNQVIDPMKTVSAQTGLAAPIQANCDYLHTAVELGIPALIIAGLFFGGIAKKLRGRLERVTIALASSVVITLVVMLNQTAIRYGSIAGTFVVLLALLSVRLEDVNA